MDDLYTFVYRGVLTDESLDKIGRRRRGSLFSEDIAKVREALAFEILDPELVTTARRMAIVYTALHAFENSVRKLVSTLRFRRSFVHHRDELGRFRARFSGYGIEQILAQRS